MKLRIINGQINSKASPGTLLNALAIETPLLDAIERLEARERAEAYSRRQAKSHRRAVRQGRHDGQNAPMLGQITPPGAEFRAVFHDKRHA